MVRRGRAGRCKQCRVAAATPTDFALHTHSTADLQHAAWRSGLRQVLLFESPDCGVSTRRPSQIIVACSVVFVINATYTCSSAYDYLSVIFQSEGLTSTVEVLINFLASRWRALLACHATAYCSGGLSAAWNTIIFRLSSPCRVSFVLGV